MGRIEEEEREEGMKLVLNMLYIVNIIHE